MGSQDGTASLTAVVRAAGVSTACPGLPGAVTRVQPLVTVVHIALALVGTGVHRLGGAGDGHSPLVAGTWLPA